MAFIEAPTNFYLGRTFDPSTDRLGEDVVYYDSRDLTTHAVVVGMTGSGKTGLCVTLLEEAVLDNIPAIIIDPKGDITNLLLAFPNLRPEDFQPWVQVDDARRAGMDIPSYSADVAHRWRSGLEKWGIVPDRLTWYSRAAKFSIYTPGSDAGLPISILASLRAPQQWTGNEEAIREKINGITTALLALAGLSVEPVKDKEHVLVANIFEYNWRQGINLTLEDIILQVQKPPFDKLGVFPIDDYISEKQRFKLAMDLNNIIAAPSFQSWIQGEPMDIQRLLYQPNGRPKVSIFYIAHLNEAERMFITTLILESMLGWMRTLSGTTSLRALLYIDEMFGYFPPYPKNPPTKEPLMRLLKQARAFGIGLIMATQNPGDLDYKGLTNTGTWFIGRLQSDNDRRKVMDGLQALASADEGLDLRDVEALIADIRPRVFLMRNVHNSGGPLLVHTRWSMSYLSGPMTRQQVQILMHAQRQELMNQIVSSAQMQRAPQPLQQNWQQQAAPPSLPGPTTPPNLPGVPGYGTQAAPPAPPGFPPAAPAQFPGQYGAQTAPQPAAQNFQTQSASPAVNLGGLRMPAGFSENRAPISSAIAQYFLPALITTQQALVQWQQQTGARVPGVGNAVLAYRPVLFAQTTVRFSEAKAQIYTMRQYGFHVADLDRAGFVNWEDYIAPVVDRTQLGGAPFGQAIFGDVPPGLTDKTRLTTLKRELTDTLYGLARIIIPFHPTFKLYGHPDKDASEFQAQVYQVARERRDKEVDDISRKFGAMMDKLEDRQRRKHRELEAEKIEIRDRKREQLFTTGEALYSLFQGRTNYTLSRMSRTSRMKRQTDAEIKESREVLDEIDQEMLALEQQYEATLDEVDDRWARIANDIQEYTIPPLKKDITVEMFGIGWLPYWYMDVGGQPVLASAFQ